ncbi:TonB-dependent receptor [Pseudoalteromonas tunicata]|jgi:iron complex outermembrane receptor protein|uniref:TonB-dependent receptor n=1 Tax=Pseudoalteromonas tunicata D2 TaxID=87626 RepID=A4C3R6_9GAMM|nr:TonB-dependent receptor [Pseudoalteromonas tunicata]ATC96523.1 iron complex outermembrane recepter protein [Pseudoalteromonas tunicata]AXT33391.1 TonB-dependent receptor [Pseudoalteromonas tunicata]EAR30198.1 TonB-dependent receptor [Pseudoalteromonas tunicata D2]
MSIKTNCYLAFCITAALQGISTSALANDDVLANQNIETIEVRGIRRSLEEALNTKRFADSVIDSISAEDIGKFPDKNIGDAMQRIPGVTVVRTYGEVNGVTVRGTAPEHSMVLLNGQNVASVGWFDLGGINRSFNFEMLAAEQISGMDLFKSVEANVNEGAIGGTVNLKTRKPLDLDSGTFFASIEGAYHTSVKEWDPAYSALGSWKTDDDTFGILVAYSKEESKVYRETLSNFGSPAGANFTDTNDIAHATYGAMSSILFDEDRERSSTQVTLQYAPSTALTLSLNYNLFELNNDHNNSALFGIVGFGTLDGNSVTENSAGVVIRATTNGVNGPGLAPLFNNTVLRTPEMQTDALNFTVEYAAEDWSVNFVAGSSSAQGRTKQSSTWWGDTANAANASFTYDVDGALEIIPTNSNYMKDHNNFMIFTEFTYINYVRDNDIDYYQADFTYQLDRGIFSTIEAGFKYQDQIFASQGDYRDVDVNKAIADGLTLADFNGGFVSGLHSKAGRSGSLSVFPIGSRRIWSYAEANQASSTTTLSKFSIDEAITASYVKANFSGEGFRGNVGLRFVDTEVVSKGLIDNIPSKGKKDYSNFLPSVNIAADIAQDLIFRFAAGSTVSRPDYDDMQMAETISVSFATATVGSPDLKPYKADQYDIGLEWYFDSASVLGATLFVKNISDYIETTSAIELYNGCSQTCLVTRSRNVGTANVSGLELQLQHNFGNGFGLLGNYTYTDSEVTNSVGKTVPINEVSKNSYNASVYYENEMFSVRLAYNYRDNWMRQYNNSGSDSVNDAYDQLDASFVWHALDNVDISIEAVNLTNEVMVLRQPDFGSVVHSVDEFGTRYFVGASVRF